MNEKLEKTSVKVERDEKGRILPGQQSLNPFGKPEGSISLVTDIKSRLIHIKKTQPDKYQSIIDDYWMDRNKRELLIKIVEPGAFAPQVAIQNNFNFTMPSDEECLAEAYELVAKDKKISVEELKG